MKASGFLRGIGVVLILTAVGYFPALAASDSDGVYLDKIVVTPSRNSQEISEAASSLTVISQDEIANSGAADTVDILRGVPAISARDLYGNGVKSVVDLAGFGDMAAMNTLVLIDGRRVNEIDLSGVDWSQIPLDRIQKIEIIRGGNSVLYGENAIGGVINIITKKGEGKPKLETGFQYGSYGRNLESLIFSGSQEKFSYLFNASRQGTNGYRNNTFFKAYDYGTNLEYNFTDQLSAYFSSGFHRGTYGLPGGLSEAEMRDFGRRYAKNGDDRATDKDYYFTAGAKNKILELGKLSVDLSYRIKDVNSDLIGFSWGWNPIRITQIKTVGVNPKFTIDTPLLGKKNNLVMGVDFYRSFYTQNDYDTSNSVADIAHINKDSLSGYLDEEFFVFKNLSLLGGFRYEQERYAFNYHDFTTFYPDIDTYNSPNEKAYKFGINYKYGDNSNLFFNLNQSYRFPAIDEFFTGTLDTSLKPQVSKDFEAGVRQDFGERLHLEISAYRMKTRNELFTDPTLFFGLGATSNYDKTIHQGINTSFDLKVSDGLSAYGSYSYQDPQFDKGSFGGNTIPWVPNQEIKLGLRLKFLRDFMVNLGEYYTGSRYRINDVSNALPRVKGYFITDLGLNYSHRDFTLSANINNLFNEYYYDFATYGVSSGNKLYYPAPGRNFSLKLDYKF